jgi:hypothetical protein
MTDYPIRLFANDAAVRRIGEGLLARNLPRSEWTHEAHLAACLWLLTERPDIVPERDLPEIISSYNESVGTANTDSSGYHGTLTQLYIRGVGLFLDRCAVSGLVERVNALLASPIGSRDWPLRFYSREVLFSVAARRDWVEPDVCGILL